MIQRIVYFVSIPLYHRDYERFGAEIMIDAGFEVTFFNFTPFIYPLLYNKATKTNRYDVEKQKLFFKEEDSINEISKLEKGCFVVSLIHYRNETFKIYRALSKTQIPYALPLVNGVHISSGSERARDSLLNRILTIKLSRLPSIIKNIIFNPVWAKYLGIREPALLIAGGEYSLKHPQMSLSGAKTEISWLHDYDYDIYIKNKQKLLSANHKFDTAVFIDSPSPRFAHDVLVPGIHSPLTEAKYFPSLRKFFNRLEKELNVKVEIAAHPKSEHEMYPDYFGKRKTILGQTFEMIKQSKIVINRNSTSVNFAVLLKKPVIFLTSYEAESYPPLSNHIRSLAGWLGKEPINIDHLLNIDWEKELYVDESAYSKYKNSFIKKDGTKEAYIWQTVAERIKGI